MTDSNDATTTGGDRSTHRTKAEIAGAVTITARSDGTVWITVDVTHPDQLADTMSAVYDVLIPRQRDGESH